MGGVAIDFVLNGGELVTDGGGDLGEHPRGTAERLDRLRHRAWSEGCADA